MDAHTVGHHLESLGTLTELVLKKYQVSGTITWLVAGVFRDTAAAFQLAAKHTHY